MRPALKSVGLAMLLVCSTTIALCAPTVTGRSPVLAQSTTTQDRKAEADRLLEQGIQKYQMSQYEAAHQSWGQALAIYRAIQDLNGEASALRRLGIAYASLLQYDKAISFYQQALSIFQQLKDRNGQAKVLLSLGNTYKSLSQYEKAIRLYQQALPIFRQVEDRNGEAWVLGHLGEAFDSLSQYDRAIEFYQQALPIFRQFGDRNGEAAALNDLGVVYKSLSQYDKAIEFYQQALPIFRQLKDRSGEAGTLGNLGVASAFLSQYDRAIEFYQQALPIFRQLEDRKGEAGVLNNLGEAHNYRSQYNEAIEFYQQALPIFRQLKDRDGEASTLMNLGIGYLSISRYSKAIEFYQQALTLFQQVNNRNGEAKVLTNFGNAYHSLSQYDKAISFHQQALLLFQQIKDRNGKAGALINLGGANLSLLQYGKAITFYQQALLLFQHIKDRNGEAKALNSLGNANLSLLQYDKAITYYQQALVIFQQVKDLNRAANVLMNLGSANLSLLQYDKAITFFQQALPLFQQVKDRAGEGNVLNNIGYLWRKQNQPEIAIVFLKQSVNVRESIRGDIRKLPRESQESYTQSIAGTYRALANLLIEQGRLPEAQAVLELLKLRELRDFTRDAGINSTGISLAKIEETALQQILKRFTTVGDFSQRIAECEQKACSDDIQQLKAQRDQLNTAINQELSQQRSILAKYFATEGSTLTPEKLNAEARRIVNAEPGTVLIYPLILKDKIQFLLALNAGDGAVTFRPFETRNVSATQLFNTIQTFRNQLKTPGDLKALQATSKQLYDWLIKPLEPELNNPNIQHLVFAPDSTTRYIPLTALFDGKQYLIERYTITTITAASQTNTTDRLPKPIANQPFLLAMGASVFANASPLDNVPAELDAITQTANSKDPHGIYPGTELLNTAFDYAALKQHLPGTRILHIATHGNFVPGRPEDSFLLPGRGENITTQLIDQLGNYGIGDVHLVVLSACETAVGDRASDGIEIPGISYFFLKNDVKAVLASLWSVNDASTSLIMQQFYKNLSTRSKAQALREVQQQFITGKLTAKDAPSRATLIVKGSPQTRQNASGDFTHPFYWAPFILIGNGL